jgi:hypothetical protein
MVYLSGTLSENESRSNELRCHNEAEAPISPCMAGVSRDGEHTQGVRVRTLATDNSSGQPAAK